MENAGAESAKLLDETGAGARTDTAWKNLLIFGDAHLAWQPALTAVACRCKVYKNLGYAAGFWHCTNLYCF